MSAPIFEQETIINIPRDEDVAYICTSDTTMMTRLDKHVKSNPAEWKLTDHNEEFKFYQCPKSFISYKSKKRTQCEMTEEERQRRTATLLKYKEEQRNKNQ